MDRVRASAPQLQGLTPYDPKYLPADAYLSANENPHDMDEDVRTQIMRAVKKVPFNRYPDSLANELRDMIAEANGLDRENVLVGNGGDELLFDLALAWGGPGRKCLDLPPTFSVYAANARLTNTEVVNVARKADFSIDEEAVLSRVAQDDIDYIVVASPNNPTGLRAPHGFLLDLLNATDALVMVDEAYFEFSRETMRPYLANHENLVILRTFSKAFSLAGVRLGYLLASPRVIDEFLKVRQPYSVDAVSQAIARVVYENRGQFERSIERIIAERERVMERLERMDGIRPYPSDSNWVLFAVASADGSVSADPARAQAVWEHLYENGVLVRDFSHAALLEGTLRVTIGTPEQNDAFLVALEAFLLREDV